VLTAAEEAVVLVVVMMGEVVVEVRIVVKDEPGVIEIDAVVLLVVGDELALVPVQDPGRH
jgi:hypothetical protein